MRLELVGGRNNPIPNDFGWARGLSRFCAKIALFFFSRTTQPFSSWYPREALPYRSVALLLFLFLQKRIRQKLEDFVAKHET